MKNMMGSGVARNQNREPLKPATMAERSERATPTSRISTKTGGTGLAQEGSKEYEIIPATISRLATP
jgi:hypothetical protein